MIIAEKTKKNGRNGANVFEAGYISFAEGSTHHIEGRDITLYSITSFLHFPLIFFLKFLLKEIITYMANVENEIIIIIFASLSSVMIMMQIIDNEII